MAYPKLLFLCLTFECLLLSGVTGQSCGVTVGPDTNFENHLNQNKHLAYLRNNFDTAAFSVVFVGDSLAAEIAYDDLENSLPIVNDYFSNADIAFKICEWTTIPGPDTFTLTAVEQLNEQYPVFHKIRVYIVESLIFSGFNFGGYAKFPWESNVEDRFIILKRNLVDQPQLIAHELGHYYGLLHTHERAFGVERVKRENCDIKGDFCCDTPADPGLSYFNMTNCFYTGNARDMFGDLYTPITTLIMSYAPYSCTSRFSAEQADRMKITAATVYNNMQTDCSDTIDIFLKGHIVSDTVHYQTTLLLQLEFLSNTERQITNHYSVFMTDTSRQDTFYKEDFTLPSIELYNTLPLSIHLPQKAIKGPFTIYVHLDPNDDVYETDELNNIFEHQFQISNTLQGLTIFPNPALSSFRFLHTGELDAALYDYAIYDLLGRKHISGNTIYTGGGISETIDIRQLIAGIYVLEIAETTGDVVARQLFCKS